MNGTGRSGSCVHSSGGCPSGAGARSSRPSPNRLLARPSLAKWNTAGWLPAGGQDRSSRHSFTPMTKIRTGAGGGSGVTFRMCSSRKAMT